MKKCNSVSCTVCPYVKEGKSLSISGICWSPNRTFYCTTYSIIYAIMSKRENCKHVYIGETKRPLKFCLADHHGNVVNKDFTTSTGHHFNLPSRSLSDLSISVLIIYNIYINIYINN